MLATKGVLAAQTCIATPTRISWSFVAVNNSTCVVEEVTLSSSNDSYIIKNTENN
ncbi:hypothetical protein GYH30_026559 [Glycine max]|nr:hypothetical protein GYH30_026559 [Glycine max]